MKELDRFGRMVRRAAVVGAVVWMAGSAEAKLSSSSYVLDGLILQWDGIENETRGGAHNPSAAKWIDLAGNGYNLTPPTSDFAFTNGCGLSSVRATGAAISAGKLASAFSASKVTFEVAYDKTKQTPASSQGWKNTICVMLLTGDANYLVGTYEKDKFGFNVPSTPNESRPTCCYTGDSNVGRHSFACRLDGTAWSVDVDGTGRASGSCTVTTPTLRHGWKFNRAFYDDYGLDGIYHAFRAYDRALTDDEVKLNNALDQVRFFGADVAAVPMPDTYRFVVTADDTNVWKRLDVTAVSDEGGTVSIDGGAESSSQSFWIVKDTVTNVTLRATARDGYAFFCWTGGVPEAKADLPEVTVDLGASVAAVFRKTDGSEPRTYTCAQNGAWLASATWRDADGYGGRPILGDTVVIPSGKKVHVDAATEHLAELTVAGTLTCSNWATRVWADATTIANGGVVTCDGLFTGESCTNRVWLRCTDLTVAAGGKISLDGKGFAGGFTQLAAGYGPGTVNANAVGCSHGGMGGRTAEAAYAPAVCGSAIEPELPGSGGRSGYPYAGKALTSAGGGAVRIEAAGRVTVNGSILASGQDVDCCTKLISDMYENPGSGGSVWISCATFAGTNGVIRANGGGGGDPRAPYWLYPKNRTTPASVCIDSRATRSAGGGRIAIHVSGDQKAEDVVDVEISTGAGLYKYAPYAQTYADMDLYRSQGDCGTVWFSDTKLLDATLGRGLTGQIGFVTNYTYSGDLDYVNGHVRFSAPGAQVTFDGNLTLSNGMSRLEVGGCAYSNRTAFTEVYGGTLLNRLTVKGDLSLLAGARVDIRSAAKATGSDFDEWGGEVKVTGRLHVASNSSAYAWCDVVKCTAPRFVVGSLTVDEGGLLSSRARGGAGAPNNSAYRQIGRATDYGYCPMGHYSGRAPVYQQAGQHVAYGGAGYGYNPAWIKPLRYDTGDGQYRPQYAGTGGGGGGYGDAGAGGGVIRVESAGAIVVNGEINADGDQAFITSQKFYTEGGGSGGTIYLEGRTFSGGEHALLSAQGGAGYGSASTPGGAGAGGCIAVWTGSAYPGRMTHRRVVKSATPLVRAENTFLGTVRATGGGRFVEWGLSVDPATVEVPDYAKGGDGTVWFCHVKDPEGLLLLVR